MAATIEDGIFAEITGDAAVAALISERLYANVLPQDVTYPAATYQRVGGGKLHTQGTDSGVAEPVYQFIMYAETYDKAVEIREAFRAVLQDFSGDIGSKGVTVLAVLLLASDEDYDNLVEKYYQALDFEINHIESRS